MTPKIINGATLITLSDGNVVRIPCHRHGDVYKILCTFNISYFKGRECQGFIAYDGEYEWFVKRNEAARIAFAAGQIKEEKSELFTEDLW